MPILQTSSSLPEQVQSLSLRSSQARLRADSADALHLAEQAWVLAKTDPTNNVAVRLNALVELTLFHLDNHADYPQAFAYALKWKYNAEKYAELYGDKSWLGFALTVMGDIYHRVGNESKALEYFTLAMPMRTDDMGLGWTFYNCSAVYFSLGNTTHSVEYAESAYRYAKQSGFPYGQAAALTMLGSLRFSQHDYKGALHYLRDAEDVIRNRTFTHLLPDVLICRAGVLRSQGKYNEALQLVEEAEAISIKGQLRESLAASYRERALILKAENKFSKAEHWNNSAISLEEILHGASVQHQLARLEAEQSSLQNLQYSPVILSPSKTTNQNTNKTHFLPPQHTTATKLLTKREREIARFLAANWSYADIADNLNVSAKTIETHRTNIIRKLKEHYGLEKASNRDVSRFVRDFG